MSEKHGHVSQADWQRRRVRRWFHAFCFHGSILARPANVQDASVWLAFYANRKMLWTDSLLLRKRLAGASGWG